MAFYFAAKNKLVPKVIMPFMAGRRAIGNLYIKSLN
jgi:hypothetical protein